jgi:asparagine synthase (glutamine-hydrolysing)
VTRCAAGAGDPDVRLAAKVASALELNWRSIDVSRPTGTDLLRLLQMKGGMNHLGMAFILSFFDTLKREFGREMVFLTGDGGDKVLPDHRPKIQVHDLEGLMRYVLAKHEILPLQTVARLTGVSALDIMGALEDRLRSYPEEQLGDKHVHFVLFERAFKWLFEGEDRNRQFFWSVAPFYAREAFVLAMKCPARSKIHYSLYRCFMESLNPDLVDIESTTRGSTLRRRMPSISGLGQRLRLLAPGVIKRRWRRLTRPRVPPNVLDCIRAQAGAGSSVSAYLSVPDLNETMERLEPTQASMLLTLTSTLEYFTTGRSTLERYPDSYF